MKNEARQTDSSEINPEKWQRVKDIFAEILEHPEAERTAFLNANCGGDPEIKKEVEDLLIAHFESESFIESPAIQLSSIFNSAEGGEPQAERNFGHYKIIREIGVGGMGAVFLAERDDGEFTQQVAIKIVRQTFAGSEVINHFKRERQILASLNHPNVARLLDGGVTNDGLPFIVMEYIDGKTIAEYAEENNLSIKQRLELFLKVCAGVAYAHRNLIVHRDLKPSNIFVTRDGTPKLLDFGLAKLIDDNLDKNSAAAVTVFRAMTPAYASPEQLRGASITTVSDIYSLGVLLYELLSGRRPFNFKSQDLNEVIQVVCESEPPRPSEASQSNSENTQKNDSPAATGKEQIRSNSIFSADNPQLLRGDLDNIVLAAMRKEPERRYPTVEEFAEDIERYLSGRPIRVRPNTFSYRAEKFIKRNLLGVGAVALIILSLLGGMIATIWQAQRANAQKTRAEKRFNDVRRLSHSLMFEIHDSVQNLPGSTPTRQIIVSRALEYLDSLAQESGDDSSLQRELAAAYEKIGDIQGNPYSANLGDTDGALASYHKAVDICEALRRAQKTIDTEMEAGRAYRGLGDILESKGSFPESLANYRTSLAIFENLAADNPGEPAVQDELARAYETLGDSLSRTPDKTEKAQSYRRNLEIRQSLLAANPSDAKQQRSVALAFLKLGTTLTQISKTEAVENLRRGTQILEALSAAAPNNAKARREVGYAYFLAGNTLTEIGDYAGALESRQKAFQIRQEIAGQDLKNQQAQFDFAAAYADLAEAYTNNNQPVEGFEQGQKSLEILNRLSASDSTNAVYRRNIGYCYERMGEARRHLALAQKTSAGNRSKYYAEAVDWYQKASDIFSALQNKDEMIPADAGKIDKLSAKISECRDLAKNGSTAIKKNAETRPQ